MHTEYLVNGKHVNNSLWQVSFRVKHVRVCVQYLALVLYSAE